MTTATVRRPGVVTFIGAIVLIQGMLGIVAGIALIVFRDNDDVRDATNQTADALVGAAIGEIIVAVLFLFVGWGLLQGGRVSRFLVAFAEAVAMCGAVWLLLTHHTGGYPMRSLTTILIGVFVLWALYAHPESEQYFESSKR